MNNLTVTLTEKEIRPVLKKEKIINFNIGGHSTTTETTTIIFTSLTCVFG